MKINVHFVAKEQIKQFARDNCLTQEEIDLFSKLIDCLEVD